jgi:ubiquinone/menaquinone biosynthesis C-methylase UbiE
MVDWAAGHYERTAEDLAPVAVEVTTRARLQPGERVLDIACGTGNAALLAAKAGAAVTGIDLARRLVEAGRQRATAERLDVDFHVGDAQALPFGDGSFDVAVSVFGIIFVSDARRAFSEVTRVLRPGGRALITAWTPDGAIAAMSGLFTRAVADATNAPPTKRFAWHEPDAISNLAASNAADARFLEDGQVTFTANTAEDYLRRYEDLHPASKAQRPILEQAGTYDTVRAEVLTTLTEGNESRDGFAVTSRYRIIQIRR